VLSGDDGLTYEVITSGGDGVISVASNLIPKELKAFVDLCREHSPQASSLNEKYREFFSKIFIQTNPLPVKTYLANKGIIKEAFRLPMCKMDEAERKTFLDFIANNNF
jgi:4-hydroxy-tetrahydrodipicolinate synthase